MKFCRTELASCSEAHFHITFIAATLLADIQSDTQLATVIQVDWLVMAGLCSDSQIPTPYQVFNPLNNCPFADIPGVVGVIKSVWGLALFRTSFDLSSPETASCLRPGFPRNRLWDQVFVLMALQGQHYRTASEEGLG